MKKKKVLIFIITGVVMAVLCSITVFAYGEVANAVSNTWTKARGQIKSIVNDVVFPVIDVVLAILLFVKISTSYMDYHKHGQFECNKRTNLSLIKRITGKAVFGLLFHLIGG